MAEVYHNLKISTDNFYILTRTYRLQNKCNCYSKCKRTKIIVSFSIDWVRSERS